MTTHNSDIIIAGSGPAGAAAASVLARAGYHVLLLDRAAFPRDKACGDGISNNAVGELEQLGVWPAIEAANFRPPLRARSVAPGGQTVDMALPTNTHRGRIAPRQQFDAILHQHAIDCGAEFRVAHVVAPLIEHGRVRGVVARTQQQQHEWRAPLLIAADGANSVIAERLGRSTFAAHRAVGLRAYVRTSLEQGHTVHIDYLRDLLPGYAWLFPAAPHLANIGVWTTTQRARARHTRMRQSLRAVFNAFVALPRIQALIGSSASLEALQSWTLNLGGYERAPRAGTSVLFVGDAAGFVNAATGAGIVGALASGRMAAEVACRALATSSSARRALILRDYDARWRSELLPQLQRGALVQQTLLAAPLPIDLLASGASAARHLGLSLTDWLDKLT